MTLFSIVYSLMLIVTVLTKQIDLLASAETDLSEFEGQVICTFRSNQVRQAVVESLQVQLEEKPNNFQSSDEIVRGFQGAASVQSFPNINAEVLKFNSVEEAEEWTKEADEWFCEKGVYS